MTQTPAPAAPQKSDKRRGARVLIVDADEAVARICLKTLRHERFELEWVQTTEAAWEKVESWRPQLYVVGDDFGGYLGLELVGQLRGRTNAPILLLTTSDSVGYQINCLEAGADDVLVRPVAPPLLMAKAQSHMRRAFRYSVPPVSPRVPPSAPVSAAQIFDAQALSAVMSSPPEALRSVAAPPKLAALAPVTPDAVAPTSNFQQWPRCEICNYMGPRERFEGKDEHGRTVKGCPACGETRLIRIPR